MALPCEGPEAGAAVGPAGNVAVRGPTDNVAVGNTGSYTNVYRQILCECLRWAYPYYGTGAVAAGVVAGAAIGAAAASPYYYPYYYPQPYYQPPCGPPYTTDTTNCPQPY